MKAIVFVFALFSFSVFGLQAQSQPTPKVKQTQVQQHKRIKQGVRSGELTRPEAVQLQKQQVAIQRKKRVAKADGVVSPRERRHIRVSQKKASANIYHQKHDRQERR
jgi:hypothetical protein